MNVARLSCTWLLTVPLLAGCDGDSDSADINRTGAPVLAYGAVTALDGVWVNGAHYDTSRATITIDGQVGVEADIHIGDIVLVAGRPDPLRVTRFLADRVTVDDAVEGPIAAIDAAANTLVVLGQTVRLTPTTMFEETMPRPSLAGFALGETVEVAGFRMSNADIIATRLEPKAASSAFETTGVVAILDEVGHQLLIGALTVDYGTPSALPAALRAGDIVNVKGSVLLPGGELVATSIARTSVVSGVVGERVEIEGYVTRLNLQAPQTFHVAGVPTRMTNETVVSGGSVMGDAKVVVMGSVDSAGTVVASTIGRTVPGRDGPFPPSGSYSVVGQLFDASNGVVGNAPINLWIQTPTLGYSYWWANGALYSNGSGEFTAANLPTSDISIHAGHRGFVQPCAVNAHVPVATYLQVEVLAGSAFDSPNPPRPQFVSGITLTGTVFETVNGSRQAVPGASIWAYSPLDVDLASTRTDLQGRFFLCNLPAEVVLATGKNGFALDYTPVRDTASAGPIDIELHRE